MPARKPIPAETPEIHEPAEESQVVQTRRPAMAPPQDAQPQTWAFWHAELARRAVTPPEHRVGWMPDYGQAAAHVELAKRFDASIGEAAEMAVEQLRREVVRILAGLSEDDAQRDRRIAKQRSVRRNAEELRARFAESRGSPGHDVTYEEIATELRVSKQRVKQIEVRAMAKLRALCEMRELKGLSSDLFGSVRGLFETWDGEE